MNLQNNEYINQSDIFSMDYIRNLVKNFENGNKENAILLSYMASLESFFKNCSAGLGFNVLIRFTISTIFFS